MEFVSRGGAKDGQHTGFVEMPKIFATHNNFLFGTKLIENFRWKYGEYVLGL